MSTNPLREAKARLYNTPKWRKLREQHRKANPICVGCGGTGYLVDHIRPHTGSDWASRFYDPLNLQTMCRPCHAKKTYHQDDVASGGHRRRVAAGWRGVGPSGAGGAEAGRTSDPDIAMVPTKHTRGSRKNEPAHAAAARIQQQAREFLASKE